MFGILRRMSHNDTQLNLGTLPLDSLFWMVVGLEDL